MKRREKKLSVMDWVLVGLLDTLAGVVAGGLMAIWQLPSAYRWRGYWAIGGEWLLVIIAIIMAVRLTHAFQMFMIFGGKKHGTCTCALKIAAAQFATVRRRCITLTVSAWVWTEKRSFTLA